MSLGNFFKGEKVISFGDFHKGVAVKGKDFESSQILYDSLITIQTKGLKEMEKEFEAASQEVLQKWKNYNDLKISYGSEGPGPGVLPSSATLRLREVKNLWIGAIKKRDTIFSMYSIKVKEVERELEKLTAPLIESYRKSLRELAASVESRKENRQSRSERSFIEPSLSKFFVVTNLPNIKKMRDKIFDEIGSTASWQHLSFFEIEEKIQQFSREFDFSSEECEVSQATYEAAAMSDVETGKSETAYLLGDGTFVKSNRK